jgi:CheY-like chemotaxis protein
VPALTAGKEDEPTDKFNRPIIGNGNLMHAESSKQGPLILLAEDNEPSIEIFSYYLESKGYRVAVARNGMQAVSMVEELRPDLILMDIQMPAMDGLTAIKTIRSTEYAAATPIIALTALAMLGDRERCIEAGANEYVSKPVSLKRLVQLIDSFLVSSNPVAEP